MGVDMENERSDRETPTVDRYWNYRGSTGDSILAESGKDTGHPYHCYYWDGHRFVISDSILSFNISVGEFATASLGNGTGCRP